MFFFGWGGQYCRQPLVTGTSVLGIQFEGGIMLAADNLGALEVMGSIVGDCLG